MEKGSDSEAPAGPRVFVSYARGDQARVRAIVAALTARGYTVWWDHEIAGGTAFSREIEAELKSADVVVVAWSRAAVESDWVRDEAAVGRDRGRLVPLQLDDTPAPLGFRQYHLVNLAGWNGRAGSPEIARLYEAVDRAAGAPAPTPGAAGAAGKIAASPSRRLWLGLGAAAVPLAAVGGWWLTARRGPSAAGGAPAHSVAVLPFANLTGDPGQDYFSDGLSEELRGALSRIDNLQVAARTSSNLFRNAHEDTAAIARKLGVVFVLDGSVRRAAGVVRVSAQLVEGSSGFQRWTQTYDRPMADVFGIQSDIARLVADALRLKMLGGATPAATGATTNPQAYDAYLRGRQLYDLSGDEASYRQALTQFDAALAADPAYAAAHAARSRTLVAIGNQFAKGADRRATYDEGLKAAEHAVALAPEFAEAQSTLAYARLNGRLDIRGATQPYERSRDLGQGDADVLVRYGLFAARTGRFDAALAALTRAGALDPLNPRVHKSLGSALYASRRYADAVAAFRRALALSPKMNSAHASIGDALMLQGLLTEARAEYLAEPQGMTRWTGLAIVQRKLGDTAAAQESLARLTRDEGDNALYQRAQILAQWGDADGALGALEQAYTATDAGLIYLKNDPLLDPLRTSPRYARLLSRLGFV